MRLGGEVEPWRTCHWGAHVGENRVIELMHTLLLVRRSRCRRGDRAGASAASCLRCRLRSRLCRRAARRISRHDVRRERTRRRIQRRQRAQPQVLVVEHVVHRVVVQIGDFGRVEGRLLRLVELALQLRPPAIVQQCGLAVGRSRPNVLMRRGRRGGGGFGRNVWRNAARRSIRRRGCDLAGAEVDTREMSQAGRRVGGRGGGRRGGDLSLLLWWWWLGWQLGRGQQCGRGVPIQPLLPHALSELRDESIDQTMQLVTLPGLPSWRNDISAPRRGEQSPRSSEVMASMSGDTLIEAAGRTTSRGESHLGRVGGGVVVPHGCCCCCCCMAAAALGHAARRFDTHVRCTGTAATPPAAAVAAGATA